ncbi:MAG: META domain-containing protein [Chitinophagaceae bacterium]|nr:META domain-containing protein [Chitinophagaceae bacterium]
MKNLSIAATLIVAMFIASCGTSSSTTSTETSTAKLSKTLTTLSETNWRLFSMNAQKANAPDGGQIPTLSFDPRNMTVSGNSGCNTFSGAFTAEKDAVSFGNLVTTRMSCPDMKMETAFLSALPNAKNYTIYEGKLVLNDAEGKQLMSFDPLPK